MQAGTGEPWIATERTHPLYVVQVFGSWPIVIVAWIYLWFHILVPQVGLLGTATTGVVLAVAIVSVDAYFWAVLRPAAIRASSVGVEVQRKWLPVFLIPAEKVQLFSRRPAGFGYVAYHLGHGFFLSPKQFEADKLFYPVGETKIETVAPPLP